MTIRQNLVDNLKSRDLTASRVAAMIGLEASSVSRWVSGETWPTPENLENLAKVIDCEAVELLMSAEQLRLWRVVQALRDVIAVQPTP